MKNYFEIKNITKKYGKHVVLKDVSCKFPYGNIIGLLGLNGAGKTTMFDIIAGFIDYKGVVGKVKPYDVSYMPTADFLNGIKTIKQTIEFYKDFMPNFNYTRAFEDIKYLNLNPKKRISKLSMGQKRIVAFVLAINCDAKIYLFDEPFTNLDLIYRDYVIDSLVRTIYHNKVYVISSHEIVELENLLSHIFILKNANLSTLYSVEEIKNSGITLNDFYKRKMLGGSKV